MNKEVEQRIESMSRATLQPLVQQVLADEAATVLAWSTQALDGGFSGSTVYRVQGQAQSANQVAGWSLILKVISPSTGGQQPADEDYWRREALLYDADLLADLPGDLVAPRCFAIVEHPNEEVWLWLEDMGETAEEEWPLERYGVAARHLGRFNGLYLTERQLPQAEWLSSEDMRQRLTQAEPGIAELPQLRHHPLFAELLAGDRVERILQLWAERERLLAGLDRLPQTFCHRDAFRYNLIDRRGAHGRPQTVALDWGMAGRGVLGAELVPLFAATLRFVAVEIHRIPELDALIFAGYLAGLRDAGWQGDERLVRFGFTASAALKAGVANPAIKLPNLARRAATLPPGAKPPRLLSPGGYPQAVARHRHLLAMGEEALQLSNSMSKHW